MSLEPELINGKRDIYPGRLDATALTTVVISRLHSLTSVHGNRPPGPCYCQEEAMNYSITIVGRKVFTSTISKGARFRPALPT